MSTPTIPRSRQVDRLIAELTPRPQPIDDLRPYVPEGPEEDRALKSLGLKKPRPSILATLAAWLALYALLCAALFGSVEFVLWALTLFAPDRAPL